MLLGSTRGILPLASGVELIELPLDTCVHVDMHSGGRFGGCACRIFWVSGWIFDRQAVLFFNDV